MVRIADRLNWYWNRFRCMSVAEIAHRSQKTIDNSAQRLGFGTAQVTPEPVFVDVPCFFGEVPQGIDRESYVRDAEQILEGKIDILSRRQVDVGAVPRWNRNAITGENAPMSFGKSLNYRDSGLVGDIKYIWVPNRHLQWVTLAQAYHLTHDSRFLEGLEVQLRSWLEQVPYLRGPNWTSSLELAIRLINWAFVWHLTGGNASPLFDGERGTALKSRWMQSVFQQVHFIKGHLSRHSSANNHLIGELAGVFIATSVWPFWKEFESWRGKAREELIEETLKQNTEDGVNREQAIFYQQFVLDFLLIAGLAGKAGGDDMPGQYWSRIESMLGFLAAVMDCAGNVPMIGDADDGYVTRLARDEQFDGYRSLLATGAILFGHSGFKEKAKSLDDKTLWLLGPDSPKIWEDIQPSDSGSRSPGSFKDGGYYLLGKGFGGDEEILAIFDAAPLGYLSICAHGHADALSFTLSVAGKEILVDPGTYAYQTKPEWRNYFRSTAAHNTVTVDGHSQSVPGGNFMWLTKASTTLDSWESTVQYDRVVASHNGYLRLPDPVAHKRSLHFDKSEDKITVADDFQCDKSHTIRRYWHFSEECKVEQSQSEVRVTNEDVVVLLRIDDPDTTIEILEGCTAPIAGWISRNFDVKVPTVTVVCTNSIAGTCSLQSEISIDPGSRQRNRS